MLTDLCLSQAYVFRPLSTMAQFRPQVFKRGLVNGLIHRAWKICSNLNLFHNEMSFLKDTLVCNGYPASFIDCCIRTFLDKRMSNQENLPQFGPARKLVLLCLPYTGANGDKIKRQLCRLLSATMPCIDLRTVFIAKSKLSKLTCLKHPISTLYKSGVVYCVQCSNCDQFYVGMTTRRLHQRISEHRDNRNSALQEHSHRTNHVIDFDNARVLASDIIRSRLYVMEALKIKELAAHLSLNRNTRGCELKLW